MLWKAHFLHLNWKHLLPVHLAQEIPGHRSSKDNKSPPAGLHCTSCYCFTGTSWVPSICEADWQKAISLCCSTLYFYLFWCQCFWFSIPSLDLETRCLPGPPLARAAVSFGPFKDLLGFRNSFILFIFWKLGDQAFEKSVFFFLCNYKLETLLMWVWHTGRPGFHSS